MFKIWGGLDIYQPPEFTTPKVKTNCVKHLGRSHSKRYPTYKYSGRKSHFPKVSL